MMLMLNGAYVPSGGNTPWPRIIAPIMCGGPHGLSPLNTPNDEHLEHHEHRPGDETCPDAVPPERFRVNVTCFPLHCMLCHTGLHFGTYVLLTVSCSRH